MTHEIAVIPGDGIGQEVTPAAVDVLDAVGDFEFVEAEAGDATAAETGTALPSETHDLAATADATLFGAAGETAADVILPLRSAVDSFVNVRPARAYPGVDALQPETDLVFLRENTEGVYAGLEDRLTDDVSTLTRLVTKSASRRLAEYACEYVAERGMDGFHVAHKSNVMRVTDGVIALPLLPLLIVLAAIDFTKLGVPEAVMSGEQASLYRIVGLVAIVGWTTVARLVRGAVLSLKTREFVLAAQALGAGNGRVMAVHLLPNVASPIIVATTLSIGNIILLESVLSFLGLGIQPPMASWGNMLTNAQELIYSNPMLAVWPGLLIFLTVIAFNFLGDGLQDALDPRSGLQR